MEVTLIGVGLGNPELMTGQARSALEGADLVLGSRRLLGELAQEGQERIAAVRPGEILRLLLDRGAQSPCVLFSGDAGFFSGARGLIPLLEEEGLAYRVLPGISSAQYFAARLGRPWQDWNLVSAHSGQCDPVAAVLEGRDTFFLTGAGGGPGELCKLLERAGLGELRAAVGEELSYPDERVTRGTVGQLAGEMFSPLSVLLVQGAAPRRPAGAQGIPDGDFLRGDVPMTKQEVRAAALAKLEIRESDVVYDVGAGTGSVSVELALQARKGRVFAVEEGPEAVELIRRNRERFGCWNLEVVPGSAPGALDGLPVPDAAFVGGSGGRLEEILECLLRKNPGLRLCVSAVAAETLGQTMALLAKWGYQAEVTQISAARSRTAGRLHLMTAQNPVWLICTCREDRT